jgi:hypothetical protein
MYRHVSAGSVSFRANFAIVPMAVGRSSVLHDVERNPGAFGESGATGGTNGGDHQVRHARDRNGPPRHDP